MDIIIKSGLVINESLKIKTVNESIITDYTNVLFLENGEVKRKDLSNILSPYIAGSGLTLTNKTFSLPVTISGTGTYVQSVTQNTNGLTVTLGTPPNTNTTYALMTQVAITAGVETTGRLISAKLLFDNFLKSNDSRITNWDTAFNLSHTHPNKAILDATTASFTTALKTKLDGLSNYILPVASATVLGGIKVGTNLSITADGVLSSTNTTYTNMSLTELNTGTATSARSISSKTLNDWLNSKSYLTSVDIDGFATETWVSTNFMSITHVANTITNSNIINWNKAFTDSHTHANKSVLDGTTASFTTALKTKLDGLSNYTLPIASATVLGGVRIPTQANGGDLVIDSATGDLKILDTIARVSWAVDLFFQKPTGTTAQYIRGDGSLANYSDTTYGNMTLTELIAGTATTGRVISAKTLTDWATDATGFVTIQTNQSVSGLKTFTNPSGIIVENLISNTNSRLGYGSYYHSGVSWRDTEPSSGTGIGGTISWKYRDGVESTNNHGFTMDFTTQGFSTGHAVNRPLRLFGGDLISASKVAEFSGNVYGYTELSGFGAFVTIPYLDDRLSEFGIDVFTRTTDGLVPAPTGTSSTRYLREDGLWVVPTNTTYTNMTLSELNTGTVTTGRLISSKTLNDWINTKGFLTEELDPKGVFKVSVTGTTTKTLTLTLNDGTLKADTWTDLNTTYTAGNGMTLIGTEFTVPVSTTGTGTFVKSITQTSVGLAVTMGTPPNTTYSAGTLAQLNTGTATTNYLWSPKNISDFVLSNTSVYNLPIASATVLGGVKIPAPDPSNNKDLYIDSVSGELIVMDSIARVSWAESIFFQKPTGTTAQYIRGDGSLATYANTTYSVASLAELQSTTSTTGRLITGQRLNQWYAVQPIGVQIFSPEQSDLLLTPSPNRLTIKINQLKPKPEAGSILVFVNGVKFPSERIISIIEWDILLNNDSTYYVIDHLTDHIELEYLIKV